MNHLLLASAVALVTFCAQSAYADHKELRLRVPAPKESIIAPTPLKAEEKLRHIPGAVDLVKSEEFEKTRAVNVKDMLEFTPGVFAQPRVNEESRLSIRGSGLARNFHLRGLNLYQDNIPVNLADGSADFQDLDPLAFRYVEVYKGANALPMGSASLGGAVNFVTPTGYDADLFQGRAEAGSFNMRRFAVQSGQVIGDSDYFASMSTLNGDGFRNHSDIDNLRFYSNLGQKLNANLETRFYLTLGDMNQELPGNLTKAQLSANPEQANPTNEALNYQRDFQVMRLANKTTWRGEDMEISGGIYTMQKDLYHPIFQLIDQETSNYGIFANSLFFGSIAGQRNEFTIGTNLSHGRTNSQRYANLSGEYGAQTSDAQEIGKNATIYLEDRYYPLPDLALIAGTQFLYANRDYHDRFFANGDQSAQRDYYGISPRLGALWEVTPEMQVYGNLSKSIEPPTLSDLTQAIPGFAGFADIEAQRATTFELGSRGRWRRIEWDAAAYRAWVNDEIMMYNIAPNTSRTLNADRTIHQGFELGFGATLFNRLFTVCCSYDRLKFRTAYTYSDFHFDGDATYGDNQIPGAPEHFIRSELRYEHPDGWYIAPNMEAVPDGYPVDMANTLYSSGYITAGLRAGLDLTERTALFLDARNLTDKAYAATADVISVPNGSNQAVFSPGDGRSVYMGLTYKF